MTEFNNRVFGCAVVKAVNANYNADFSHQPRTLPDGIVYATDKAFKYSVRNYWTQECSSEKVFFYKRLNSEMNPLTLLESYESFFPQPSKEDSTKKKNKGQKTTEVLENLLQCIDIRCFGATFAAKGKKKEENINLSLHGTVQIGHGLNRFANNEIFSEQIMSPFRNPGKETEDGDNEKSMTTLGQQSKLREGHYVHHFSVNPRNLQSWKSIAGEKASLRVSDIQKLKDGMCKGVTYYDSAAKSGCDNEFLLWVQLKKESKIVLPVFTELLSISKKGDIAIIDLEKISALLENVKGDIEEIEMYYIPQQTEVVNAPQSAKVYHLTTLNIL